MWNAISVDWRQRAWHWNKPQLKRLTVFHTAVIITPLCLCLYITPCYGWVSCSLFTPTLRYIYTRLSKHSCLFTEVTLKVHLSDASTHQPLGGAAIQLFANHTSVTTETSSADGNTYLRFPYRLGTPLVVTATKQGYVPNSVPWSPSRLPGRCVYLFMCVCGVYVFFPMSIKPHWI